MSKPLLSIVMLFSIPAFSQPVANFEKKIFSGEKGTLPYRFLQPENTGTDQKFPLVIFLHGAGERGQDNDVQTRHAKFLFLDPENRRRFPCYVLAPQCPAGKMWAAHDRHGSRMVMRETPTDPMSLLIALLAEIETKFPIDPDRIYVTGLSMGGYGTWDLIARFPERFAAAVPVCGGGDPDTAPRIKHIPIWAFHGALDQVVVPGNSRTMIAALREAGGRPGYTEYPDVGHNSWTNAYNDPHLLPWMFDQSRTKSQKTE